MFEIKNSSEKALIENNKDYMSIVNKIPWDKFEVGKSVYMSYDDLTVFDSPAHCMNYLRTIANRRGIKYGFKFKVVNHPDSRYVELNCYATQDALPFKPLGRPKKVEVVVEDRAGRYNRATDIVNAKYAPMPTFGTPEYKAWSRKVTIETDQLFNQFEAESGNNEFIDIDKKMAMLDAAQSNPESTFTQREWKQFPSAPEIDEQE